MNDRKNNIQIENAMVRLSGRAKSRKEIASEYGISPRTFQRWLKKNKSFAGLKRELIRPADLIQIYREFGLPARGVDDLNSK